MIKLERNRQKFSKSRLQLFRFGLSVMLLLYVQNLFSAGCLQKDSLQGESTYNFVFLGDSNLWTGGDDSSNSRSWSYWFCKDLAVKNSKNYARSGATWTHTKQTRKDLLSYDEKLSDNNVILNQVLRLITDVQENRRSAPTYIFIMAGTNDAWFQNRRPQLFSETVKQAFTRKSRTPQQTLSLAGAVKLDCELLKQYLPKSKIILITPMLTTQASVDVVNKVTDIIDASGKRLRVSVIRLDKALLINPEQERQKLNYTLDGTHTSPAGAEKVGEYILKRFKEIIQLK